MGLGILDPNQPSCHVVGTVQLLEDVDNEQVVLNPRPSESPNDPLVSVKLWPEVEYCINS